jgi:FKBP-type peptidyl-prolyl cis-trans isomerase
MHRSSAHCAALALLCTGAALLHAGCRGGPVEPGPDPYEPYVPKDPVQPQDTSDPAHPAHPREPEVRTPRGIGYDDVRVGKGPPAARGDSLLIDYTLWLEDGRRVDSTLDRGLPLWLTLGEAFVRGLDDGMEGMRAGGRRRIVVPPELGYGAEGVPGLIPANATLVFEVHLIQREPPKP